MSPGRTPAIVRRILPLAAVAAAVLGGATLRPGAETGACAQGQAVVPRADCASSAAAGPGSASPASCAATTTSFVSVSARPKGRGLRLSFRRRVARPVRIDVFQSSTGRRVLGQRLVARFSRRTEGVRWSGRRQRGRPKVRDGVFFARFTIRDERGRHDERRVTLVRRDGRFRARRAFYRRTSCATLTSYKLERPVFGGRSSRALGIAFRLARHGRVSVEVRRGGRVVKRYAGTVRAARRTHRLRLAPERLRRGTYEIRLTFTGPGGTVRSSLFASRL